MDKWRSRTIFPWAAIISLGLREQPDAIANPWNLVFQDIDRPAQLLENGTPIKQVYEKADGELLILGEPGSGKTTLLLELTRDLIAYAKGDATHPIPVIFNLSSWATHRQPLTDWLVEELNTKYQVPHKIGQLWVDNDEILPLLDGLDEVNAKHRLDCINAINAYRGEHGLLPLVVCSRLIEYQMQHVHLLLCNAVIVQPLTSEQIELYLMSGGAQLEGVRSALKNDPKLLELASTPLMLSILALAYSGISSKELQLSGSFGIERQQIFKTYVRRMLQRRTHTTRYQPKQIEIWLTWLAGQMKQHNQTVFYLEQLQPDWLSTRRSHILYNFIVNLGIIIALFLIILIIGKFFFNTSSIITAFTIGIAWSTVLQQVSFINLEIRPVEIVSWSWFLSKPPWRAMNKTARIIIIISAFLMLAIFLFELFDFLSSYGPLRGLAGFILVSFIFIMIIGLNQKPQEVSRRIKPNQGIWQSAQNGIIFALIFGSVFGLLLGFVFGVNTGIYIGSVLGIAIGLRQGGTTCIQHILLRLFLWKQKAMPINYIQFLNYAVDCILLLRVGGGYIFIHPLLLEYFESLS